MVLYEVCTGLRACEKSRDLREYVSEWQQKNLMDSKAGSLFSHVYAPMMHLGDKCTENKRDKRPEMILVHIPHFHQSYTAALVLKTIVFIWTGAQGTGVLGIVTGQASRKCLWWSN